MLVLLTLAVVAQVCCVRLFLHICFGGWKRTVTPQEVPCRVVDDKGRQPPTQNSVPSSYVVVVVAAFAAVVVVVDAVVVAQARRHTAHTHTRTRTRSSSRTPTHTHTSHTKRDTQAHTHARTLTHEPTTKTENFQHSCSQREQRPAPFPTRPRRTGCASFRDSFGPSRRARHP